MAVRRLLAAALAFFAAQVAAAAAQTYPSRPVTMIVPYPAGGPTDTLARILSDHMKSSLGQSVIIENIAGGGGSLGAARVARAAPDGYTLSIGHWNTHVVHGAAMNLPYVVLNDFAPVALLADTPIWLVARNTLPAKDFRELLAWLKQNEGKATAGTVGLRKENGLQTLTVATGNGLLNIEKLQLEGKKVMSADEFLRGYSHIVGETLD